MPNYLADYILIFCFYPIEKHNISSATVSGLLPFASRETETVHCLHRLYGVPNLIKAYLFQTLVYILFRCVCWITKSLLAVDD